MLIKCSSCDFEYVGNYCPNCGVPADIGRANPAEGSIGKRETRKDVLFVVLCLLGFLIGLYAFIVGTINFRFNKIQQELLASINISEQALPEETGEIIITKNEEVPIALEELITVPDQCEFVLRNISFSKKVVPPNAKDYYTYYEAKNSDLIYLDIVLDYKNLDSTDVMADETAIVKIIYDDKYEYSTFSIIEEDNGSNFTYTNITAVNPLKTETIHFLSDVPNEVESSKGSVKVLLRINNIDYIYSVK